MGNQRLARLQRRAARAEAGLTKDAEREQREFEALVARKRQALEAVEPVVSRAPRRVLLAWIALAILLWFLAAVFTGALR